MSRDSTSRVTPLLWSPIPCCVFILSHLSSLFKVWQLAFVSFLSFILVTSKFTNLHNWSLQSRLEEIYTRFIPQISFLVSVLLLGLFKRNSSSISSIWTFLTILPRPVSLPHCVVGGRLLVSFPLTRGGRLTASVVRPHVSRVRPARTCLSHMNSFNNNEDPNKRVDTITSLSL